MTAAPGKVHEGGLPVRLFLRSWLCRQLDQINAKLGEIMSALTDLQTATGNLAAEITTFLNDIAAQVSGGVSATDAEAIVTAFTLRLRDAVDLDTVRHELLAAVDGAVQPAHASVWLRAGELRGPG